jgi:ubiquinone/menaquinone biosynthesis C-methylase UbiE
MLSPNYPLEFFNYLTSISPATGYAWDCGTGIGGAAICLSEKYNNVFASDRNQTYIRLAPKRENILYLIEKVENNSIPDNKIDLVTVAQSLHHFKVNYFFKEAKRVLKPGGILAAWCFGEHKINKVFKKHMKSFIKSIDPFWANDKEILNNGYKKILFPFKEIRTDKRYNLECNYTYYDYFNYLGTLSATKRFIDKNKRDPRLSISQDIIYDWGGLSKLQKVKWPIHLLVGQK